MKYLASLATALTLMATATDAWPQDYDAAAERARIANERIAAEAARRAAVDDDLAENAVDAASSPAPAPVPQPAPVAATPAGPVVSSTTVRSSTPAAPAPAPAASEAPAEMPALLLLWFQPKKSQSN